MQVQKFNSCRPDHPGRGLMTNRVLGTRITHVPQFDAADEVQVARTPLAPRACDAFPPDELEARLALYADRAARGVPVCTGEPAPPAPRVETAQCWGCGRAAPAGNQVNAAGWYSRPAFGPRCRTVEVHCPQCFGEWGWIDHPA